MRERQGNSAASSRSRTALSLLFAAVVSATLAAAPSAHAHDLAPPRPKEQPVARWPDGKPSTHDVVVPVVLTITPDGNVADVVIEASLGDDLDAAATVAARKWQFEPATSSGHPVAAKIRAAIRFVGVPALAAPAPEQSPPAVVLSPKAAPAAPAPPAPVTVVGHGEGEHAPKEVRVAGERKPPPRSASELIQGRAVLQAAPHRTAGDLLLAVPGVYITQHGGEGKAYQIFFRGFDAEHGQDVEIWAGGAPVNAVSNLHGQGYADLHFLMPEIVKEIRSTPGTYDPRQGDFAVAGSLHLALGYDEPGITAKATAGSFGARRYFLAYRPRDADESTFAAFEVYATDGFGPARAARRTSGVAQATYDVADGARLRVMTSTYATRFDSAGVLTLSDIERRRVDRYASYDPSQGGNASRSQLVVELSSTDEASRWSVSPYLVLRSMRLRQNFTGYLQDPKNGDGEQQLDDATTVGARAAYRLLVPITSPKDVVEAGVSTRTDWVEQSQRRIGSVDDQVTAESVNAKVRATDTAGYLDFALHPIDRVALRAGARIDGLSYAVEDDGGKAAGQARSSQGAHLGKKATAEVRVARGTHLVASYGEGFRSPQARSLGDGQTTPFTSVTSYEAGGRYRDGERLRATAAVFRTTLSDDLVFDQATARNERVPGTSRTGVTAELAARPHPDLTTAASLTYTRAVFRHDDGGHRKGDLLPYAPQVVVRSDVGYTPRLGVVAGHALDARVGYGLTFLDRRPLPYGEMAHDVLLVDATASLRWDHVQVGVDVFNVLGADWYDGEFVSASRFSQAAAPSLVPQRHVTVGAPRTILASLALFLLSGKSSPMRWPSLRHASLLALLCLVGCSDEATQGSATTGKRVVLHGAIQADPEIAASFSNAGGWSITLTRAAVAIESLYFFDGAPAFVLAPRTPRERLAALFSAPVANAHPGHYVAGSALGQMLSPVTYDLFAGTRALPDGDGVTGTYRSARLTFGSGGATAEPGSHAAVAEGSASKAGKTVFFRLTADRSQLEKSVASGQIDGCVFDEAAVDDTGTVTLVVKPSIWFNLVDFADVAPGSPSSPTEIAEGDTAQIGFALGLVQLTAYHFRYAKRGGE